MVLLTMYYQVFIRKVTCDFFQMQLASLYLVHHIISSQSMGLNQPLAHIYFLIVYDNLMKRGHTISGLVTIARHITDVSYNSNYPYHAKI